LSAVAHPSNRPGACTELARTGHTEEAIAQFRHLLTLQPNLDIDPETEVQRVADQARAQDLVLEARKLAVIGEVSNAAAKFQEAIRLDPELNFDAKQEAERIANLVPEGERLAKGGQIKEAIAAFMKPNRLIRHTRFLHDPEISCVVMPAYGVMPGI